MSIDFAYVASAAVDFGFANGTNQQLLPAASRRPRDPGQSSLWTQMLVLSHILLSPEACQQKPGSADQMTRMPSNAVSSIAL